MERAWNKPWIPPSWADAEVIDCVVLFPEDGYELPMEPRCWWRLGLSRSLLDDLADWQKLFDWNFDAMGGGFVEAIEAEWSRQAAQLEQRLRDELPPDIEVLVDLWPLRRERPAS